MTMKEDMNKIDKKVTEASFAMRLVEYQNQQNAINNRRLFVIIIILILALASSISYTIYLLNNIGEETTITKTIDVNDITTMSDSEINNN